MPRDVSSEVIQYVKLQRSEQEQEPGILTNMLLRHSSCLLGVMLIVFSFTANDGESDANNSKYDYLQFYYKLS